jgi:hypothetical protein
MRKRSLIHIYVRRHIAIGVEMETPKEVICQYYGDRSEIFIAGFGEQ